MPISHFDHQHIGDLIGPIVRNLLNDLRSPAHKNLAYYFVLD